MGKLPAPFALAQLCARTPDKGIDAFTLAAVC